MTTGNHRFIPPMRFVLASIVTILTLAVVGQAVQTITTPNYLTVAYNLVSGANSSAITPAANLPVLVLGDQTTGGNVGSSLVTIVNSVGQGNYLVWNGFESFGAGLTTGYGPRAGVHIIFIDNAHCVDLKVNNTTSFLVHNGCTYSVPETGNVTLIW